MELCSRRISLLLLLLLLLRHTLFQRFWFYNMASARKARLEFLRNRPPIPRSTGKWVITVKLSIPFTIWQPTASHKIFHKWKWFWQGHSHLIFSHMITNLKDMTKNTQRSIILPESAIHTNSNYLRITSVKT